MLQLVSLQFLVAQAQSRSRLETGCCTLCKYVGDSVVRACSGFGPQKLATLAAYALRRNLLIWLETYKVEKLCAERVRVQRSVLAAQVRLQNFLCGSCPKSSVNMSPQHAT